MDEKVLETPHFVCTDIEDDYHTQWYGSIMDANPVLENGNPIFIIISSKYRVELNTIDIAYVEKYAKRMTYPQGRQATTFDVARIYIKEKNGNQMFLGSVTHTRNKTFMPVYNKQRKKKI